MCSATDGRIRDFTVDNLNRRTAERWMNGGTAVNTIATGYNADGQITTAGDSYSNYALSFDGATNGSERFRKSF